MKSKNLYLIFAYIMILILLKNAANAQTEKIINDFRGLKSMTLDKKDIWEFKQSDKINIAVEKIDSSINANKKHLKSYHIKFQLLTSSKDANLKAAYGNIVMNYVDDNIAKIEPFKLLSLKIVDLNNQEYQNIIDSQKFWKEFIDNFLSNKREIVVEKFFDYPIKSYSTTIDNSKKLLNSYDVYFYLLKKKLTKNSILSFPAKSNTNESKIGDCFIEFSEFNPDDEENPMISLRLVAKKIGKEFKIIRIELGS